MSFLQRSNNFGSPKRGKKSPLISACIVVLLIVIFSFSAPRNFLLNIFSPLWSAENSFLSFFTSDMQLLRSKSSLVAENNALQAELAQNQENVLLDTIVREQNADLENILNRKSSGQTQILAAVLEKPFLSPYDTLIIDAGSSNGVSVGDQVLANGTTYIGTVSTVSENSAKVTLYSSPGEQTNVLIGTSSIERSAVGLGGGNFSVDLPKGLGIAVGDSVVIPSLSANVFAKVGGIETSDAADSFETILFKSPVNIDELTWVEVLPNLQQ